MLSTLQLLLVSEYKWYQIWYNIKYYFFFFLDVGILLIPWPGVVVTGITAILITGPDGAVPKSNGGA